MNSPVHSPQIDVVLLDLGGIIVELGGADRHGILVGTDCVEEIVAIWSSCSIVQTYESGLLSTDEFARGMIARYGLALKPSEFLSAYCDWVIGPYPGAKDLVSDIALNVRCACFSNIGELHWHHQNTTMQIDKMFDTCFLSFKLGLTKPDPSAFIAVAQELECDPARILFLDDSPLNVDGARLAGFISHKVDGPAETRELLMSMGLLSKP